MRRCQGPGWALVGDAGYYKDPLSAHGLTDALRDAELLARAVSDGLGDGASLDDALEHYQTTRDRLSIPLFDVVDRIASQQWDDTEIAHLLLQLSSAMTDEIETLAALDTRPSAMSRRTLLGVWAHPDDEAYTSAGLMADVPPPRRSRRGHHRHARRARHQRPGDLATGPARRAAAHRAPQQPRHPRRRRAAPARLPRRPLRAGRRHRSHRRPHRRHRPRSHRHLRTRRHDRTPRPPGHQSLDHRRLDYHPARRRPASTPPSPPTSTERWGPINDQVGLWADQPDPPCTAAADLPLSTRLPDTLLDLKVAALEAHASQTRPLIELVGPAAYREWWRTESFRKAPTGAAVIATPASLAQRTA